MVHYSSGKNESKWKAPKKVEELIENNLYC